ncbi:hypothetical protein CKA32_006149 [Geitlerinema sp. FC II]|nr:hypothetical protein CKA32_006149 [Geitlerinema sp. FC II]
MCGESRTHGFEAEGKKATSGSTVTGTGNGKIETREFWGSDRTEKTLLVSKR